MFLISWKCRSGINKSSLQNNPSTAHVSAIPNVDIVGQNVGTSVNIK